MIACMKLLIEIHVTWYVDIYQIAAIGLYMQLHVYMIMYMTSPPNAYISPPEAYMTLYVYIHTVAAIDVYFILYDYVYEVAARGLFDV